MTKKIIGIAGNQLLQAAEVFHGNQVTYTPQGFVSAVQAAGGVPLVLPIGPKELAATYIQQIDKLLLAGGQDVAPEFYGQEPHIKLEETYFCGLPWNAISQCCFRWHIISRFIDVSSMVS